MAKRSTRRYCSSGWVPNVIGYPQSETNRTEVVPVEALNNYELAIQSGAIPPDTTLAEYLASLKGEPGKDGTGINIKGNVSSYAELLAIPNPELGDSYALTENDQAWLYTYGVNGWPPEGQGIPIQGEPGDTYIPELTTDYFDL